MLSLPYNNILCSKVICEVAVICEIVSICGVGDWMTSKSALQQEITK